MKFPESVKRRASMAILLSTLGLTACNAGAPDASEPGRGVACVLFNYGSLRKDVTKDPVPRTAEAARRLLAVVWQFQNGESDPPADLVQNLHGTKLDGTPRPLEAVGAEIDAVFSAYHPSLGNGGPVADDRASLSFDLKTGAVGAGAYLLPFTAPKDKGRGTQLPAEIDCNAQPSR